MHVLYTPWQKYARRCRENVAVSTLDIAIIILVPRAACCHSTRPYIKTTMHSGTGGHGTVSIVQRNTDSMVSYDCIAFIAFCSSQL